MISNQPSRGVKGILDQFPWQLWVRSNFFFFFLTVSVSRHCTLHITAALEQLRCKGGWKERPPQVPSLGFFSFLYQRHDQCQDEDVELFQSFFKLLHSALTSNTSPLVPPSNSSQSSSAAQTGFRDSNKHFSYFTPHRFSLFLPPFLLSFTHTLFLSNTACLSAL